MTNPTTGLHACTDGILLPATHGYDWHLGHDGGGPYIEWYADDDGGSGYGDAPLVQRCYYGHDGEPPRAPTPGGWHRLLLDDGPDRTDPGYHLDNF